jgi:predicted MFS family arabinose efflux permease
MHKINSMSPRQFKAIYFALTALNTYATTCFFYYLFFFLRDQFAFGNRENLWVSALHGFFYIFAAWQCGKFAQRRGFLTSLKLGYAGLTLLVLAGGLTNSVLSILFVVAAYTIVLLFTWPALEALVSENESQAGVQHMVGIYNCTWATAAAVAYFTGGPLYDWLGRGAIFWIPGGIFLLQFLVVLWVSRQLPKIPVPHTLRPPEVHPPEPAAFRQPVSPETFLKMAWLANPFAYVAINTVFAVMPGIAARLGLSPTQVGLFCSVWLFARLAVFVLLWRWTGWHYRFRWLLAAFLMLIGGFLLLSLAPKLWTIVLAQLFFGFATGLIYYSSLFYSMDVGKATAEHGGLHEAAIGIGIFAGPAVGAAALQFLPEKQGVGIVAVGVLLFCGLLALIWLRLKK